MTYRPAKAKPKRRRRCDDIDQARLDLRPHSDLDREVQKHVKETRRELLPGQAEISWEEKP